MPKPESSAIARALAAHRTIVVGDCAVCGEAFIGMKTKRYCSAKCVKRAYRARKKTTGP